VATIRQVEVDIVEALEQQKSGHKEERHKAKYWGGKAAELAKQIAEHDGAQGLVGRRAGCTCDFVCGSACVCR